jgi:hypothetical protein
MAKGNADDWDTSDMLANQAELDMASNPSRAAQIDTFVTWAGSKDESWKYIEDNGLNKVAKRNGATVGVRKAKRGGGYEVYTSSERKR